MFDLPDTKSFMDNVHGYIRIPKVFVKHLIDTPEFQRLRNIDQTGMKILYPAAKHDRFSHSLGVFHLGSIAVNALLENFQDNSHWRIRSDRNHDVFWAKNKVLFLIACLLHDIGHAPFSHSLEQFYDLKFGYPNYYKLLSLLGIDVNRETDEPFSLSKSKEHERMSAFLILKEDSEWRERIKIILDKLKEDGYLRQLTELYGEYDNKPPTIDIDETEDDIQFIARMILGVKYPDYRSEKQIRNCFIELLNGNFDVDKLDYTVRDTKMSGIGNISLDIDRLLTSLTIIPTTIYTDTDIEINKKKEQSIIITKIEVNENDTLAFKGKIDREIVLTKGNVECSPKTRITLYPRNKDNDENIGITTAGAKVTNDSIIIYNRKLLPQGGEVIHIPSMDNDRLEIKNINLLENFKFELTGSEPYNLSFDSVDADEELKVKVFTKVKLREGSIKFNGSLTGRINRLEILSDELSENHVIPTEKCYTGFSIGFKKQAINLLSNVTDARNYLYLWIYSHHKVIYYANFLIMELARISILRQNKGKKINDKFFEMMTNKEEAYRLDEDFIHNQIHEANGQNYSEGKKTLYNELISRNYRSSLYKSLAEFDLLFGHFDIAKKEKMRAHLEIISTVPPMEAGFQSTDDNDEIERKEVISLGYGMIKYEYLEKMEFEGKKLSNILIDMIWVSSDPSLKRPSPSSIYITFGSGKNPLVTTMDRFPILKLEDFAGEQKFYFYLYYWEKEPEILKANAINTNDDLKKIIKNAFITYMEEAVSVKKMLQQ